MSALGFFTQTHPNMSLPHNSATPGGFQVPGALEVAGALTLAGALSVAGGSVISNSSASVIAAGTVATLVETGTQTTLDFGTTDPTLVIPSAGTWLILSAMTLERVGATVTTQTIAARLRRTNNTAADVVTQAIDLPASTTLTDTLGVFPFRAVLYTTSNADDSISLQAAVSASMGAGTMTASAASIIAVKLTA